LISKIGVQEFLNLIKEEEKALLNKEFDIDTNFIQYIPQLKKSLPTHSPVINEEEYKRWLATNTFQQSQDGYFGVYVKVKLGNISSNKARDLASIIDQYAYSADSRITINQGFLLKFVSKEELPYLFEALTKIELATPGFDSTADITACPGTDTCNLAISNSTNISVELERVITQEFPELIYNHDIKIKISGCMNSCGQHGLAQIGFHGSSFKVGQNVIPAVQVLLGGGTLGGGKGRISEKVIKVASKRAPDVLRRLFTDLETNALEGEYFNSYFDRQGKDYFYQLLKPLADQNNLKEEEYFDWGSEGKFETAIGVGECAGVIIDLVQTLFYEAEEKISYSAESFAAENYGDNIYYTYAAFIHTTKGLLLDAGIHVNTHHKLISDFDKNFVENGQFTFTDSFGETVLQINKNEASREFAANYFQQAKSFLESAIKYRESIKQTVEHA
jgi:sulfite reductase (ferredoxin)